MIVQALGSGAGILTGGRVPPPQEISKATRSASFGELIESCIALTPKRFDLIVAFLQLLSIDRLVGEHGCAKLGDLVPSVFQELFSNRKLFLDPALSPQKDRRR